MVTASVTALSSCLVFRLFCFVGAWQASKQKPSQATTKKKERKSQAKPVSGFPSVREDGQKKMHNSNLSDLGGEQFRMLLVVVVVVVMLQSKFFLAVLLVFSWHKLGSLFCP